VAGLGESPADGAIVGGVLGLARTLGLGAVAEGVETARQAEELAALGCRLAQGFRWARPMAADEMVRWLDGYWAAHGRRPKSSVPQVVIADDDSALRRVLRAALELHGFEVVGEAANGREAIDLARRHQPQLVVLDLTMPGVGGIEALPRIREAAPAARVAILSATDAGEVRSDDLTGASAWFAKDSDLSRTVDSLAALTASSSSGGGG
jgi:CheY-like chemotaxis protein